MDVVVAAATPWGAGALALVRLTGPGLEQVLAGFVRPLGPALRPGQAPRRVEVFDRAGTFDDGLAWIGRAPHTYTGEPTAEITVHGNPRIVERLIAAACHAGARLAAPGEFTRRALANGKTDLVAAEAVLQATEATSAEGIAIARAGLDGRLGAALGDLRERLLGCAAELEARLDYPGDELAYEDDAALVGDLEGVAAEAERLAGSYPLGRIAVQGARVALVGPVNAGKSSLFNALLGRARALVHETPGTTRDVLEAPAQLGGLQVTLLDTAGERATDDPVEAAGLALARELVGEADLVIVVLRAAPDGPTATERLLLERTADRPRVLVANQIDRPGAIAPPGTLPVSARTGEGLAALVRAIRAGLVGEATGEARLVVASARQRDGLLALARSVRRAIASLPTAGVAVAAEACAEGLEALDALTGADTREDVLSALFSRFCIGK